MKRVSSILASWILVLAVTGTAAAQTEFEWRSGRTFEIKPKMNYIPNTDVYYERKAADYDLYRYANVWYIVEDGTWYRAETWRGPYFSIDFNEVPDELANVPVAYRRQWNAPRVKVKLKDVPEGSYTWSGRLPDKPRMTSVAPGVSYARRVDDFDLYRYKSKWYLVDDGVWYRSDSWRGPFFSVRAKKVPRELLNVPSAYRRHWVVPADY